MSDILRSKIDLLFKAVLLNRLQDLSQKAEIPLKKALNPNPNIRQVADQYAAPRGLKLQHHVTPVKVNPAHAEKIAAEYHKMKHDPANPAVKSAYDALTRETVDQFNHIKNSGLKVSRIQPGQENPYKNSQDLFNDINTNNHMWFFPTDSGFGSGPESKDHPMLADTGLKTDEGHPLLANDAFRIVHDYFGHAKEGFGFGPSGEENAWRHHKQMFSPEAQKALTSETRGQNSWVNFGPHGEHNRATPQNTIYADQKAGIMPDWTMGQGDNALTESFGKSEVLMKAPIPYTAYEDDEEKHTHDYNIFNDNHEYNLVHKQKLPNGLEYRQYSHKNSLPEERVFVHALYHPDYDTNIAMMETRIPEEFDQESLRLAYPNKQAPDSNQVNWSEVHPLWRGKGLGRQTYMAALIHGKDMEGGLTSDSRVSPEAHKAWLSFRGIPGLGGKIGAYPKDNELLFRPGKADMFENSRHHVYVRDPLKLPMSSIFHGTKDQFMPTPEKLAASEKLMKPFRSEAQRARAHTAEGTRALGGAAHVHEWDEATKGRHIPERVHKDESEDSSSSTADFKAHYKDFPHLEKDMGHHYLMWPVSINGEDKDPVTGHRYHVTLRHIGEQAPNTQYLDQHFANSGNLIPHDFKLEPHIFNTPNGTYHVLKMTTHPQWMQDMHRSLEAPFGPDKFTSYIPHVSVPKHMYDRFIADPNSLKLDIKPLEMWKEGETLWRAPQKLAASETAEDDLNKSKNVREQKAEIFGTKAMPPAGSEMRDKHVEHIKNFSEKFLGLKMHPSGGKMNMKTGERRAENPKVGVDKPDWRSGQFESQWNPDAMVHELAHVMLLPKGLGLKDAQTWMDKNYADVQRNFGYMKQKRSVGEVQPMAAEQLIRRALGLPANQSSVPVKADDPPRTMVEDPSVVIGNRIKQGKTKSGEDKWVDLIRQSRFLTPENKQRMEDVFNKKIIFHPDHGWIDNPEKATERAAQEARQMKQFGNQIHFKDKLAASENEIVDLIKNTKLDVEKALKEVQAKSDEQIDTDSSYSWASKAIACYQLYKSSGKIKWFMQGDDYRHEALEHAALAKDEGKTVHAIQTVIDEHREEPKDE